MDEEPAELAELLPNPKTIRGVVDGVVIVDSRDVLGVWDHRHYPSWYFPVEDVTAELRPTGEVRTTAKVGSATVHNIVVGDRVLVGAATRHDDSPIAELHDRVKIDFDAVDRWFEEDIEVFSEPKNPYVRVDTLPSSRHVKVTWNGQVVAETRKPTIIYETGVNPRYYIPALDVRLDLLVPAARRSSCPYKGFASYWSVVVDGVEATESAWGYPTPFREARAAAGMLSFYTNKLEVEIDGERITT